MPEVPGGAAVDVVVAVGFLLFVISVLCAAVAELLASALNWRGRMLRTAVARLLGERDAAALYASPRIARLHGPRGRPPSYIPARVYSAAVAELGGEQRAAADELERDFEDLMDRATGWYKRRILWTVLAIALAGCVALNADVLALGNRFLADEAVKQAAIAQAEKAPAAGGDPVEAAARSVDDLQALDLPFGWDAAHRPDGAAGWLGRLAAWLLAAVTIPMGASFWFDVLSRASRQRGAGARPGAPAPGAP
jgi:hypothetical protein